MLYLAGKAFTAELRPTCGESVVALPLWPVWRLNLWTLPPHSRQLGLQQILTIVGDDHRFHV